MLAAEPVPKSDRLLKLQVDLGRKNGKWWPGLPNICAGRFSGKTAVLVANLKPAKIRGVESQGMLLAAVSDDKIAILTPDSDVGPGCKCGEKLLFDTHAHIDAAEFGKTW